MGSKRKSVIRRLVAVTAGVICVIASAAWMIVGSVAPSGSVAAPIATEDGTRKPLTTTEIAATFLGVPESDLTAAPGPSSSQEEFSTHMPDAQEVRIVVDRERLRVIGLYHPGSIDDRASEVTEAQIEEALHRVAGLSQRLLPELTEQVHFDARAVPDTGHCRLILFVWRERQGEAYTGRMMTATVNPRNGAIQSASVHLPPLGPLPEPRLGRTQAAEIARQAACQRVHKELEVTDCELVLSHVAAPLQGPVWLIRVQEPRTTWKDLVIVDACDGQVISAPR